MVGKITSFLWKHKKSIIGILVILIVVLAFRAKCGCGCGPDTPWGGLNIFSQFSPSGVIPRINFKHMHSWLSKLLDPIISTTTPPDTQAVIVYDDPPPTEIISGGYITPSDFGLISMWGDSIGHLLHWDLPDHGPAEIVITKYGLELKTRRFGFEPNLLVGPALGGVTIGLETFYYNDMLGIHDLHGHITPLAQFPYRSFSESESFTDFIDDTELGIGGSIDLFPDHTNLRLHGGVVWSVSSGEMKPCIGISADILTFGGK